MIVTIELPLEVQEWVNRKLESGGYASPAEFIQKQLYQDWVEEKLGEAFQEPADPMSADDWSHARERLERRIAQDQ